MTKYIIFADSSDGYADSAGLHYSAAQGGLSSVTNNTTSSTARIGQMKNSGGFDCYEYFVGFDTSGIDLAKEQVSVAQLVINVVSNSGVTTSNRIVCYRYAGWPPIPWATLPRSPSFDDHYTGSMNSAYVPNTQYHIPVRIHSASINNSSGNFTRFLLMTGNEQQGVTPSGNEYLTVNTSRIATSKSPTLVVYTYPITISSPVVHSVGQLSTGEVVELRRYFDTGGSSQNAVLGYYSKFSSTFHQIDSFPCGLGSIPQPTPDLSDIAIDANDNIFIACAVDDQSGSGAFVATFCYVKGTGYSWTKAPNFGYTWPLVEQDYQVIELRLHFAKVGSSVLGTRNLVTLCCTTITEIAGSLSTLSSRTEQMYFDPSLLLTATGTFGTMLTQMWNLTQFPAAIYSGIPKFDILTDNTIHSRYPIQMTLATYETGNGGSIATVATASQLDFGKSGLIEEEEADAITLSQSSNASIAADSKSKLFQVAVGLYVAIFPTDAGKIAACNINSVPSVIGSVVKSASLDAGLNGLWDAVFDPVSNSIYVFWIDPAVPTDIQCIAWRITNRKWDTSPTGFPGVITNTPTALWTVEDVTDERNVLIFTGTVDSGGTLHKIVTQASFNVPPRAPAVTTIPTFDANTSYTIRWTPSDPNHNDIQSAYEIEIDAPGPTSAIRSGAVSSSTHSYVISAGSLAQNTTFRMRMRTYDEQGVAGAWLPYMTFSTSDVGSVVFTYPINDGDIENLSYPYLLWNYVTSGTATQSKTCVKLYSLDDGSLLFDSGVADNTFGGWRFTTAPNEVPLRADVYIINSAGQQTATVSRYFSTSYLSPDAITNLSASFNGLEVDLSWTLPVPTGTRSPATQLIICRADDGVNAIPIAQVDGSVTSYIDYIPKVGTSPMYFIISELDTGDTVSNQAISDPVDFFGTVINVKNSAIDAPWQSAIGLYYGGAASSQSNTINATSLQFDGRTRPSTFYGDDGTSSISTKAVVPFTDNGINGLNDPNKQTLQDIDAAMSQIFKSHQVCCFRDGRGRRLFGTIKSYALSDSNLGAEISFTIDESDYSESITTPDGV